MAKALHGLWPLSRSQGTPRVPWIDRRRIVRRASGIGKVVDKKAGVGVDLLKKLKNLFRGIAGEPGGDFAEGVVRSKDVGGAGEFSKFVEDRK